MNKYLRYFNEDDAQDSLKEQRFLSLELATDYFVPLLLHNELAVLEQLQRNQLETNYKLSQEQVTMINGRGRVPH